eukprot:10369892-Lingulodinium_polyedra.AAC.1
MLANAGWAVCVKTRGCKTLGVLRQTRARRNQTKKPSMLHGAGGQICDAERAAGGRVTQNLAGPPVKTRGLNAINITLPR